ncbi:hypothetical protein LR48_Vigan04g087400 [Vigna angularis]|uniref:Uncharacterized protein n=2 Tax=Phaseolus angularis TaxID=3914 RepID=A0A0L9UD88_PHAAN|nr:hypothetical protein LR48_Vigan04g087400 [Vigna angularis]BAT79013.1 hypothetical protein VIGAN_02180300 [Vigna angularis var. angularis]
MTKPKANHRYLASMLLLFLLLTSSTSSSARPLSDPTVNLALPSDRVVLPETPERVSTCAHMRVAEKQPFPVTRLGGGKHVALVLNMLPRGPVPPSAPSHGINNLNN